MATDTRERRLVSIRRMVPTSRNDAYDAAWARLNDAAVARGAHAWRFISASEPLVFLEFLEFAGDADLRQDPEVIAAIAALHDEFGDPPPQPKTLEEWVNIP